MSWAPEYDFYMATIEDQPAGILVDLAAKDHAPVAALPVRLIVRVKMKDPDELGLRSDMETPALYKLEHTLVEGATALNVRLVGRIIFRGWSDFVFYAPARGDPRALDATIREAVGDYEVRVGMDLDPKWEMYLGFLFPTDPKAIQAMKNRRILHRLVGAGDDLTQVRQVDHVAIFGEVIPAVNVQQKLREQGFVTTVGSGEGESWRLDFSRDESLEEHRMDTVCAELMALVISEGGRYDGWGCPVTVSESAEAGDEE